MKEYFRVLSYAGSHTRLLKKSIACLICSVIFSIVPYYLISQLIASFVESRPPSITALLLFALGVLVSLVLKEILNAVGLDASHKLAYHTLAGMRKTLADKLLRIPMGTIARHGTGNIKKNFVESIEEMELILAHGFPEGTSNVIVFLIITITMFVADWRLALLALGVVPFGMWAAFAMISDGMKSMGKYYEAGQRMNQNIIEYISGMEVIKVFGQTTRSFRKYSDSVDEFKVYTLDWYRRCWPYMILYGVLLPTTLLFMLPFGALIFLSGTLTVSNFILCVLLAMGMALPLTRIIDFLPMFPQLGYKAKIIEAMLTDEDMIEGKSPAPKKHDVSFEKVSFAYDETEVLKNISFSAKENTVTALVGESGAGKSTIAKLLVRFWNPSKGNIKLGGIDIREMSFETLMNQISYVSQDIFLFNASIMDNLRMGSPNATDEQVMRMSKAAQCHEFIMETEKGYQTIVGNAGDKLSGGERQRIAIARAMLKNAPVIVLDEATSFTDPENEDNIQAALNELIQGKTLIVIAHRLSTIMDADNIIVLENGKISTQGTHDELLNKSKLYQKMWKAHRESMEWDINVRKGGEVDA